VLSEIAAEATLFVRRPRATGSSVEVSAVNIDRIVDGRILEHGGAANLLGPLLKVGAVEVAGGGTE
jgi:hypothetical protein